MTPQQAAAAAVVAARAAQPLNGDVLEALVVPAGCLQLSSWQESAEAEEPPGEVASSFTQQPYSVPRPAATAAAAAAAGGGGGGGVGSENVLQPGSEVVITLAVMDTSRRLSVVQQEIQVRLFDKGAHTNQ
jgi:hypothetical protein